MGPLGGIRKKHLKLFFSSSFQKVRWSLESEKLQVNIFTISYNKLFLKRDPSTAPFSFILCLFEHTIQLLQLINCEKNVHPVSGAGIRTYNLLNTSFLPFPLDQGSHPYRTNLKINFLYFLPVSLWLVKTVTLLAKSNQIALF